MTHDERIERIARAMATSCWRKISIPLTEAEFVDSAWRAFAPFAEVAYIAALDGLRYPSEDLMRKAKVKLWECDEALTDEALTSVWHAMIDHLLNANPTVEDERIAVLENK